MSDAAQLAAKDDVDPDIRRFVDALNKGYGQFENFGSLPLGERRLAAEQVRAPWRAGGPEMWSTVEHDRAGVRLRVHRPSADDGMPAMLYIHGGGWTMFSIDTHDRLMREYAARAGIVVVGIDYSLSPEAKFPKALDEIVAAYDWLRAGGAGDGVDPARIAIGGDSAGANLSVAVALQLRGGGRAMPSALLLNYGAFDPRPSASYPLYGGPSYMLTGPEMDLFWSNYTDAPADLENPLVAPIFADLNDLPPAFFAIAECDILADCNRAMAARMTEAGVKVDAREYGGATHSFLEAMSIAPLASRAIDDAAGWLRALLVQD
ncbi:MAG: alpha/beta hydrolase [Pseudomonadota bacterium]